MDEQMDERLKKEVGREDFRAARGSSGDRRSRESDDRPVAENRQLTDDQRLEEFRMALFNDALPDLPDIPGYHVCWLSTQNQWDPIHKRLRMGYEPIRAEEAPDLKFANLKTGEWAGYIGVNEMLAFKLPLRLYEGYMQHAHHDEPRRQEENVNEAKERLKDQALRMGGNVIEGDGDADMRRAPSRGVFEG